MLRQVDNLRRGTNFYHREFEVGASDESPSPEPRQERRAVSIKSRPVSRSPIKERSRSSGKENKRSKSSIFVKIPPDLLQRPKTAPEARSSCDKCVQAGPDFVDQPTSPTFPLDAQETAPDFCSDSGSSCVKQEEVPEEEPAKELTERAGDEPENEHYNKMPLKTSQEVLDANDVGQPNTLNFSEEQGKKSRMFVEDGQLKQVELAKSEKRFTSPAEGRDRSEKPSPANEDVMNATFTKEDEDEKPWRHNMKRKEVPAEEPVKEEMKKVDDKPWRKHMNKTPPKTSKEALDAKDVKCAHALNFTEEERGKIRKFMEDKQRKQIELAKNEKLEKENARKKINEGLTRLEAKTKKIFETKKQETKRPKLTGTEHFDFRKMAEERRLKEKLVQLTEEMRSEKYAEVKKNDPSNVQDLERSKRDFITKKTDLVTGNESTLKEEPTTSIVGNGQDSAKSLPKDDTRSKLDICSDDKRNNCSNVLGREISVTSVRNDERTKKTNFTSRNAGTSDVGSKHFDRNSKDWKATRACNPSDFSSKVEELRDSHVENLKMVPNDDESEETDVEVSSIIDTEHEKTMLSQCSKAIRGVTLSKTDIRSDVNSNNSSNVLSQKDSVKSIRNNERPKKTNFTSGNVESERPNSGRHSIVRYGKAMRADNQSDFSSKVEELRNRHIEDLKMIPKDDESEEVYAEASNIIETEHKKTLLSQGLEAVKSVTRSKADTHSDVKTNDSPNVLGQGTSLNSIKNDVRAKKTNFTLGKAEDKGSTCKQSEERAIKNVGSTDHESLLSTNNSFSRKYFDGNAEAVRRDMQSDFSSKVKELRNRHEEDLKMIPKDDELDFVPVKQVPSPNKRIIPENPVEDPPPDLHFAESPDPMNFASTLRKKFPALKADADVSEGPLPSSSSGEESQLQNPSRPKSNAIQARSELAVPDVLKLRFQAELTQLEMIHKAENQIDHINQLKDAVEFLPNAKNFHRERRKSRKSIQRKQFEEMVRKELAEVVKNREKEIKSNKSSTDIRTILSKVASSSIPEVMSLIEKSDKSANSIQKTISEAIEELNDAEGQSTSSNITEDIAKELSDVKTVEEEGLERTDKRQMSLKLPVSPKSNRKFKTFRRHHPCAGSDDSLSIPSHEVSSDHSIVEIRKNDVREELSEMKEKALKADQIDQMLTLQHQLSVLKTRLPLLEMENRVKMVKLDQRIMDHEGSLEALQKLEEKKVRQAERWEKVKGQYKARKRSLQNEIIDLVGQYPDVGDSDDSTSTISSKTVVEEGEDKKDKRPISLKLPLSPKSNRKLKTFRRRHSSADSDDSLSLASHDASSDHSDMEIRISVLKEELEHRKATVAKLKVAQAEKHKEKLRMQEEALKKQIEAYDHLIEKSQVEIIETSHQPSHLGIQPQIKSPRRMEKVSSPEKLVASPVHSSAEAHTDELIRTENYSDDFTSSSSVATSVKQDAEVDVNTVDSIVNNILYDLISDTGKAFAKASQKISSEVENVSEDPKIEEVIKDGFIDDDFGLSIQQESEHLRQQQLAIEKEISRIQEESRRIQESNIPDKPPPPYTPPSPNRVHQARRPQPEVIRYVPSAKNEVIELSTKYVGQFFDIRRHLQGRGFIEKVKALKSPQADDTSKEVFIDFLFEAVREVVVGIFSCEVDEQNPVWMKQKPLMKEVMSIPKTEEGLKVKVLQELMVLFGFERRVMKENLMVRWAPQKRRDRVDQILVRELHSEEATWTDFSRDETAVKDNIACSIMDLLINDTVEAMKRAYIKKHP